MTMHQSERPDLPEHPIPEPLRGNERGTWANSTILKRLPDIARGVLRDNELDPTSVTRIESLIEEIPYGLIRALNDPGAPDVLEWNRSLQPYIGQNWLDAPWFVVETYFYRRIIESIDYFNSEGDASSIDPFKKQKQKGLTVAQESMQSHCPLDMYAGSKIEWSEASFNELLLLDLWGNRADLSLWPVEGSSKNSGRHLVKGTDRVLVDQRMLAATYLTQLSAEPTQADFILDNAGVELMLDLCLVDFLLRSGRISKVVLHFKLHPTFVSDATIDDFDESLNAWCANPVTSISEFGSRLAQFHRSEHIELVAEPFWTSPLSMWQMPEALKRALGESSLVILKGDANYRRLLGDRHWKYTSPFEPLVAYFPTPLIVIRSLKAEVAAGLPPGSPETLEQLDPNWMTNGDWGVIHFVR